MKCAQHDDCIDRCAILLEEFDEPLSPVPGLRVSWTHAASVSFEMCAVRSRMLFAAVGDELENEHIDLVRRDADGRLVPQSA